MFFFLVKSVCLRSFSANFTTAIRSILVLDIPFYVCVLPYLFIFFGAKVYCICCTALSLFSYFFLDGGITDKGVGEGGQKTLPPGALLKETNVILVYVCVLVSIDFKFFGKEKVFGIRIQDVV